MGKCPRCGKGEIKGKYKQFYEKNGDVDVLVEWKCNKCEEVW